MPLLEHGPDRYLRTPRLVRTAEGTIELYALAWEGDREALVRFAIDEDGNAGDPIVVETRDAIVSLSRTNDAPEILESPDDVNAASCMAWSVWIEHEGGRSRVVVKTPVVRTPVVKTPSGGLVTVFDAFGTAAAPVIVPAQAGAWVAFHHNVREDTGEPDLVKWIALRFVSPTGEVSEPTLPMQGRDRDREGEEQGFEFPELLVSADGSLVLFGRGSHAFFRQDLDERGWSPRVALGPTGWGCRGRWVSAQLRGDQRIVIARRVKGGVEVSVLLGPGPGRPALRTLPSVRLDARPHRDVPARPDGPDPAARDGRRTLFGDIHQHSAHSDGCGTADEPYLRARHVYGDDFCALTDHESFIGKRIGPGEWAYLRAVADRHDEPGRFATLHAYEWTGRMYPGPGHKVVYLPIESGPIVGRDDVPEGADLVARVKELGGFAVPHHVGWTGANEDAHDPVGQPVWEICSCHGCYMHAEHALGGRGDLRDQMVDAVMLRGRRFGFIACSDGHGLLYHHGVGRKRDPFRCGLTAVQAESCTRDAILKAIRERRCYATSGVPIMLDLRAGPTGDPMGSEIEIEAPVLVRAETRAACRIETLALIGPDGVIAKVDGSAEHAEIEAPVGPGWVYARVLCEDGEMAWSSPIFLDAIGGPAGESPDRPR